MSPTLLTTLGVLAAAYIFFRALLSFTQDAREPPVLETTIPFLSPIMGMSKKAKFYINLRNTFNLPIYTLRLPFTRLYIINSTSLIPTAQRQVRILDFAPLAAKVAINVMGASPAGRKILVRKTHDGKEDFSYAVEFPKAIHPAVTPGAKLDGMNRVSAEKVLDAVERLISEGTRTLKLFEWVQKEIMIATTETVYGPMNPFRDEKVREAYCEFEPGLIALLLNIFPTLFAREALKARKVLVDAFDQYFANRGQECGSSFVQTHYQHKIDQGVTGIDVARFELGGMVAILSNTVPAAFWVLYHTVSDVVVLEECRRDVMACCRVNDDYYTLDITQVKASCPLLLSILQESLRYHGIGTSVRVVMQNHMLDGRYLLKKDGIVMIPGPVQHTSKEAYGENVDEFDHKRFMRSPGRRRLNPLAFRGFGGGSTLCPGRHFATTEVLTFVALMIVRMDFEPVRGEWVCPKTDKAGMAGTIAPPNLDDDVEVLLSPATGHLAGKMWRVVVSGSDEGVPFAVEDEKHG